MRRSFTPPAPWRLHAAIVLTILTLGACDTTAPAGGAITIVARARTAEAFVFFEYAINVDDRTPLVARSGDSLRAVVSGLSRGTHRVTLSGVPGSCDTGGSDRHVSLAGSDTTTVTFDIVCARTTGDVSLEVRTGGVEPDQDGYAILIDGHPTGTVGPQGAAVVRFVEPGSHNIALGEASDNCAGTGP